MVEAKVFQAVKAWFSNRFELSRGGGAGNIRPMEGLRGFAAFLVFFTHYCGFVKPYIDQTTWFAQGVNRLDFIGNSGVDLFFVLSGYLIYGSLISRPQGLRKFISRRITRIYPVFLVVFAIYVPLSFVFISENKIPQSLQGASIYLLANLFLTVPLLIHANPLINVSWSLSFEMFYYALTPVLIVLFHLRQKSAPWRVAFFAVLAIAYATYCALYGGHPRLLMFIAGILLYETIKGAWAKAPGSVMTFFVVITGLFVYTLPYGGQGNLIKALCLFVTFFTLCFCCFFHQATWLRQVFEWTPLRWFGNMSYSFYMIHALAMQAVFLLLSQFVPASADKGVVFFLAFFPIQFVASLLPALVLYLSVERPFSLKPSSRRRLAESNSIPTPMQPQPN